MFKEKPNISNLHLDKHWYKFTVNFSKKSQGIYRDTFENKELVIISYFNTEHKYWGINIWYGDIGMAIYQRDVKIEDAVISKATKPLDSELVRDVKDRCITVWGDLDTKEVKVEKILTKKEAIKELKEIPYAKGVYDPMINGFDLLCPCGSWASVPEYGRVMETSEDAILTGPKPNKIFSYKGKFYKQVPSYEWSILTWWNREEYDELCKSYPDWPDFDKVRLSNGDKDTSFGWRSPDGKVSEFTSTPVIGAYEPVISKGWHNTPNPFTMECPCCRMLTRIYTETDVWLSWKDKLYLKKVDCEHKLNNIRLNFLNRKSEVNDR